MSDSIKVILASGSPRRRQLLAGAGIEFEVIESMVPEQHIAGEPARDYALRMAREKPSQFRRASAKPSSIGADTIVVCETQILEKPADAADARRILATLSARTHTVVTAFAVAQDGKILESSPVESRSPFANSAGRNRRLHRHRRAVRQGRRLRNPGRRRRIYLARRRIARQRDGPADRAGGRSASSARREASSSQNGD